MIAGILRYHQSNNGIRSDNQHLLERRHESSNNDIAAIDLEVLEVAEICQQCPHEPHGQQRQSGKHNHKDPLLACRYPVELGGTVKRKSHETEVYNQEDDDASLKQCLSVLLIGEVRGCEVRAANDTQDQTNKSRDLYKLYDTAAS